MHILYIHQYFQFPDRAGGTRSYDLARSFVDQGHNVTVLSSNVSGINVHNSGKWQYLERDGIAVFRRLPL